MPSYQVKQSSTAYPLVFLMIDSSDHITPKTGLSPTVTISKAGASFASPTGAVTEIGNGWYKVAGNATDAATLGPLLLHATATGADPTDALFEVVAHDVQDAAALGLSRLDAAITSRQTSIWSSSSATVNLSGTTIATLTNAPSDSSGTTTLLSRLSSARAGYLDNVNNANLASVPAFPSNFATLGINASGHVSRVVLCDTITTYTGNTVQTGDAYARIGATGSGLTSLAQASLWTSTRAGYVDNLSGGPVMLAASYSAPPSAATIADAVWDEDIVTGHQTDNMAGWSLNHIHGMADAIYGLIDTEVAAIKAKTDQLRFTVANQVDSNALTNGGLDAAGVRAAVGLASANLDTQLADLPTNSDLAAAITTGLTTALTEGYRADGATGSVRDLLYELIAHMGEASIVSTTKTLKKIDGSTTAQTYTLDSGSAPTSITRAT